MAAFCHLSSSQLSTVGGLRPAIAIHIDCFSENDIEDGAAMKFHTEYLTFNTRHHREYVHITPQVEKIVHASGVTNGLTLVSAMHITAGVYVNDDERGLIHDIDQWLDQLAPFNENYLHHQTGEDNGDSHLKAILVHHQVILPVTNGKLLLGTWQRVFYAEFDGQRSKRVVVAVMGE
jgi:secondary thiamine-phosphate synthase enzyme